jgi:hypothetical protein
MGSVLLFTQPVVDAFDPRLLVAPPMDHVIDFTKPLGIHRPYCKPSSSTLPYTCLLHTLTWPNLPIQPKQRYYRKMSKNC